MGRVRVHIVKLLGYSLIVLSLALTGTKGQGAQNSSMRSGWRTGVGAKAEAEAVPRPHSETLPPFNHQPPLAGSTFFLNSRKMSAGWGRAPEGTPGGSRGHSIQGFLHRNPQSWIFPGRGPPGTPSSPSSSLSRLLRLPRGHSCFSHQLSRCCPQFHRFLETGLLFGGPCF